MKLFDLSLIVAGLIFLVWAGFTSYGLKHPPPEVTPAKTNQVSATH